MRDVARDPAVLERLRVQRARLADRMRPPWWYLTGIAIVWAPLFASPFSSRYLPRGVPTWPIVVAAVAVFFLLQWGLARATGIAVGTRRYPSARPAAIAMLAVGLAATMAETSLIRRGLLVAAVVVAVLGVVAEVAAQQALLRGIRQDLRAGGGAA